MSRLLWALPILMVAGGVCCAQDGDPSAVLELYESILGRGDTQGALGYFALPQGAEPGQLAQAMASIDALVAETDIEGVTRALSLFIPGLAPGAARTELSRQMGNTDGWIEYQVQIPLAFRQTVYFLGDTGGWRIDVARTLEENARGTKVQSLLREQAMAAECAARLRQLSVAMGKYMDEHDNRLPSADEWTTATAPYLADPSALRCPAEKESPSIGMNAAVSELRGVDIADPSKTVLLFESQPDVTAGSDESAMARRHDGKGHVLLADGTLVAVESTLGLKWGRGPGTTAAPAGTVTQPAVSQEGVDLVAIRDCLEPLGATLAWDPQSGVTTAEWLGRALEISEGSQTARLDGVEIALSGPVNTADGKLLTPVKLLSRAFGLWVQWGDGVVTLGRMGG